VRVGERRRTDQLPGKAIVLSVNCPCLPSVPAVKHSPKYSSIDDLEA